MHAPMFPCLNGIRRTIDLNGTTSELKNFNSNRDGSYTFIKSGLSRSREGYIAVEPNL